MYSRSLILPFLLCLFAGCFHFEITHVHAAEKTSFTYGKTTVPLTVLRPKASDTEKSPVLIAMPPGPGTAQMVQAGLRSYWQKEGPARGFIIVAPQILGPKLAKDGPAFTKALFAWMDKHLKYNPARVTVAGISNGGLGAFHVFLSAPDKINGVLALPGAISGRRKIPETAKGKFAWLLVGAKDPSWKKMAEQSEGALKKAGVNVTLQVMPGQGHMIRIAPKQLFDYIEKNSSK